MSIDAKLQILHVIFPSFLVISHKQEAVMTECSLKAERIPKL